MSASNGIIRVGRKGKVKFAFGDDGAPFEVDVVSAMQGWWCEDDMHRVAAGDVYPDWHVRHGQEVDEDDVGTIYTAEMPAYHEAAVEYVKKLAAEGTRGGVSPADTNNITVAEALDFIARLREEYDKLADFFRPRSREKRDSRDTSEVELRFSEEQPAANSATSTSTS